MTSEPLHRSNGIRAWLDNPTFRRLIACLFGGFVMCLMIGNQEGSQDDFGVSFHKATTPLRLTVFLLIGVGIFAVLTFWPLIRPYLRHPGASTVAVGFLLVGAGMTLTKWYDPVGKFGPVSKAVSHSHGPPILVTVFFSPFAWVMMVIGLVLGGVAVASRRAVVGYVQLGYGIAATVVVFVAHAQLLTFAGGIDHTLGAYVAAAGYLTLALSGLVAARSHAQVASPIESIERALGWRPGLALSSAATVFGLFAFFNAAWFAPLQGQLNAGFNKTRTDFHGYGLPAYTTTYLKWLALVLFFAGAIIGVLGSLRRNRWLGGVTAAVGAVGVVLTFFTLRKLSEIGAHAAPQFGKSWQNLGAGGWLACLAFSFMLASGVALAMSGRTDSREYATTMEPIIGAKGTAISRFVVPAAVAWVLFYPPTLPLDWQNVVVTQIAAYLLLAVGLNVVVGLAGLLDLGYIAFFAVGAYTTAYFTGSLPHKPPSFLHFTPLVAIPFAIVACLIAGVLLGAPTLRLRGDYLAIVTLGFGEIIQLIAINNPGNITGGPIGPRVPHPRLHIGGLRIQWGLDNLPYWYLLLVLLFITLIAFHRIEGSRIGRAWAAIREDEVAAQATGVRTVRLKVLAFAIGASTSGVAGVFFGSQIGYFDPSQFTIQYSILIVAYVVFGGMGSLPGAIAGAAVLTWLPYFLQSQVPLTDSQMWIGALIILMMIFRPEGLIPARRRKAELAGLDAPKSAEVQAVPASEGL